LRASVEVLLGVDSSITGANWVVLRASVEVPLGVDSETFEVFSDFLLKNFHKEAFSIFYLSLSFFAFASIAFYISAYSLSYFSFFFAASLAFASSSLASFLALSSDSFYSFSLCLASYYSLSA